MALKDLRILQREEMSWPQFWRYLAGRNWHKELWVAFETPESGFEPQRFIESIGRPVVGPPIDQLDVQHLDD